MSCICVSVAITSFTVTADSPKQSNFTCSSSHPTNNMLLLPVSLRSLPSHLHLPPHFKRKPLIPKSQSKSLSTKTTTMSIEHIVLFKVRDADLAKADAMTAALRNLSALPMVSHLHAGPIHRLVAPPPLSFTHLLHSRYASQSDLSAYASHPDHLSVVHSLVLPICDDIVAVDWVNINSSSSPPPPNSATRLTLAKTKPEVQAKEVVEKVRLIGVEETSVSLGENFSPARAKGFSFAMMAVFEDLKKLEEFGGSEEVEKAKESVRPMLDDVIVADFVVGVTVPTASI